MHIPEADIDFIQRLQSLGNDNVYLGGSLLIAMIGIQRKVKDIDVILNQPTQEQLTLLKEYSGSLLDFLLYREKTPPNKNLRYKGIPLDGFESLVKFKSGRAVKKDYLDLFMILKWLVEQKPEGVDVEESIKTIIHEVLESSTSPPSGLLTR